MNEKPIMTGERTQLDLTEPAELLGDFHPLVDQLGCAEGLVALEAAASVLQTGRVKDLSSLRAFLERYQRRLLIPFEIPLIRRAYEHAGRNELKELVSLDRGLLRDADFQAFGAASRRIGKFQLQRLRPIRDQRIVQRYLREVDAENAAGWHTLVYGLTLWLYSLPLRQGLAHYAQQTQRGFIHCAARRMPVTVPQTRRLLADLQPELNAALDRQLSAARGVDPRFVKS